MRAWLVRKLLRPEDLLPLVTPLSNLTWGIINTVPATKYPDFFDLQAEFLNQAYEAMKGH